MLEKLYSNHIAQMIVVFIGIFGITFAFLFAFGLVPNFFYSNNSGPVVNLNDQIQNNLKVDAQVYTEQAENQNINLSSPDRIIIPKVNIDSNIEKPQSPSIEALDNALTKGVVYYPGSGHIERGNILLFGHSSNWKVVQNPAYKIFNGIENLKMGDEIILESNSKRFIYKVQVVKLLDENEAEIKFDNTKRLLTLSTCNTFGEKQERWVVEAIFDREV